jgi:DNA-binding NarL/FixJ family response regulator
MGYVQVSVVDSSATISVYVVAEHRLLREPVVRLLGKRTDISVVGASAYTNVTAIQVAASGCDILLLDSPTTGRATDLINDLSERAPQIQLVAFGMDEEPSTFIKAVSSGVSGYVLKDASAGEVVVAIRSVFCGDAVCPPRLCKTLFQLVVRELLQTKETLSVQQEPAKVRLTYRQRQLVTLLAGGLSNKEIAANLNLSAFTVKNHIHRIMRQVDAGDRYEVVDVIRASGLLPSI